MGAPEEHFSGTPPAKEPLKESRPPRKPREAKKVPIMQILAFIIPTIAFSVFASLIMQSYAQTNQADHELILKIQAELQTHNQSINNISTFMIQKQLPIDCRLINVTDSLNHCLNVLNGGK